MKHLRTSLMKSKLKRVLLVPTILIFFILTPSLTLAKSLASEATSSTQTFKKTYGDDPFMIQFDYQSFRDLKFKTVTKIEGAESDEFNIIHLNLNKEETGWQASIHGAGHVTITAYAGDINNPSYEETIEIEIEKAILNVNATNFKRGYGMKNPPINTLYTYAEFINPDDEKLFNSLPIAYIDPIYDESTPVGGYPNGIRVKGGSHPFYILKHHKALLSVVGIIVFPPDLTNKIYGDPDFKLIDYTKGIQKVSVESSDPDVISVSDQTGEWLATIKGVGAVTITYNSIDDLGQEESEIIPIRVSKKDLMIKADNKFRLVNEDNPPLTYTVEGLVYNETTDVLSEIIVSTDATKFSPKGEYSIQLTGGENDNYATKLIFGTLFIYKSSLLDIYVNGELHDITQPYDMKCGTTNEQYVHVELTEDATLVVPGYTIDENNGFRVVTDKPMVKQIELRVQSPIIGKEEVFILTIERRFVFDDIVRMRWNNTLTVVNNPANLFGYTISGYQWYKNNIAIDGATNQSYSAGSEAHAVLDENATYHVELTMTTGEVLRTCEKQVKLTNNEYTVEITPNPVKAGEPLTLTVNMDESELANATIDIYTIGAVFVKKIPVTGKITTFTLPNNPGMYLVKFTASSGFNQTHKVLVK